LPAIARIDFRDRHLRRSAADRYFRAMSNDPLRADLAERRRGQPATGARREQSAWLGVLGGATLIAMAVVVSIALWQLAGTREVRLVSEELTEIETLLAQLGFPPGTIDGVIDDAAGYAIRDFQVTAGLEVDGEPSFALLDELRAAHAELSRNQ
jgi:peptidoglycan hydrolase-like protein with peptidoglycan-binding domain